MFTIFKNLGRALIPKAIFRAAQPYWHGVNAMLAHWHYGRPSEKMIVIGVTGTAGKSTTVNLLAKILSGNGYKAGLITTANYSDGESEHLNAHGLSMPGGWVLQRQLAEMVERGCRYAVVECTSEGLAQNRHLGINFDAALFTNLSPAHIDNHGSFDNYKRAKGRLFAAFGRSKEGTPKVIGANLDDQHADYFLSFPADRKFGVTLQQSVSKRTDNAYTLTDLVMDPSLSFKINGIPFALKLIGEFNAYNAGLAAGCADLLGVDLKQSSAILADFQKVPGRMETIPNERGIRIFVDYAPEPVAMESALRAVNSLPHRRLIHVFGSTGGHRDIGKRFEFGSISAAYSDVIIITNDDVYDSDPRQIADNVREGIGRITGPRRKVSEVRTTLDRRSAIAEALAIAQSGDIVIMTGKGAEQFLSLPGNKRVPWDERQVVRETLNKFSPRA